MSNANNNLDTSAQHPPPALPGGGGWRHSLIHIVRYEIIKLNVLLIPFGKRKLYEEVVQ